ncbi:MAG TPA: S-layer homology domain-containing protein [Sedimentibacter sp.]|nr:S-layer homology domain-containing protein [Sedimentibacter sp.]
MKKVLSLVLVIAMILSSFSFAFAAKFEDVEGDYEEAIDTLVALGVITGYEDGTFRPNQVVTRAEMAKLIVEILGYGDLVSGAKSNFADTQGHWADPWIAIASGRGLVLGDGDGNFRPNDTVSYDEAITMVVRALGYTDDSNELKNMTWPTNFKVKASELDLLDGIKAIAGGADRGGVAQLLFNALDAVLVTVDVDGNVTAIFDTIYVDGETVRENRILLSRLAERDNIQKVEPKHLDKDHKDYLGDIVDLTPYMYQDIDVYLNDDGEVVYVSKVNSDVLEGEFRRFTTGDGNAGKVYVRIDGKNKAYDIVVDDDKLPVFYNGVEVKMTEGQMEAEGGDPVNLHTAAARFVLNDDDDIVGIVATKFTGAKRVENEYNGKAKFEGIALPLDDDDEVDYDKLTVTGAVDSLEDIEVDDVIVLFAGAGERTPTKDTEKLVIQVVRDTVEGKITRTNSDDQFYIDGKYYSESEFAQYEFEVGEEGTYFLDHQGKLVDFEEDDADEPKDYAVIVELLPGVISNNRTLADAEMTIVNAKGEEVTYEFDSKAKVGETTIIKEDVENGDGDILIQGLNPYDVIKYSVNSKGKISKVTIVETDINPEDEELTDTDITGKSYVFASNAVVFNYVDEEEVEVVDVDDLGDDVIILASEKNKNGEIEMFFVKGLGVTSTYAYIVDDGTMWNDDDERVQSLIAYVDGVEVYYETNIPYNDDDLITDIDNATIVKLNFDGEVVTGVEQVYTATTGSALVVGEITRISGDRFQVDGDWYTLDDDVVVYILDDGEFDEVGDASSIYREAQVAGFQFDEDDGVTVEILFIFE